MLVKSHRVMILDLDNTLWHGVIGDYGLDGIVLGPGNAVGEAHLAAGQLTRHRTSRRFRPESQRCAPLWLNRWQGRCKVLANIRAKSPQKNHRRIRRTLSSERLTAAPGKSAVTTLRGMRLTGRQA
jgi:hypothetical protein